MNCARTLPVLLVLAAFLAAPRAHGGEIRKPTEAPRPAAVGMAADGMAADGATLALSSISAGLGAAGGYLLVLPLGVAVAHLAPLAGISPFLGALPLVFLGPFGAALAAGTFSPTPSLLLALTAGGAALLGSGAGLVGVALVTAAGGLPDSTALIAAVVLVPALTGSLAAASIAPLVVAVSGPEEE